MDKYLIVGHHDADGSAGIAVIYKKLKESVAEDATIDIVVDNLTTTIDWSAYKGYKAVFIVDHPMVKELVEDNGEIVWLDHHMSAITDKDDKSALVDGIRSASMAGCELAYLFCYGSDEDIAYVCNYPKDQRQDAKIASIRAKAPIWIRIIGDNDNWDKSLNKEFGDKGWQLFIAANAIAGVSEICPLAKKPGLDAWLKLIEQKSINDLSDLVDYGQAVGMYQTINNNRDIKNNLIDAEFKDLPGVKVALLNTSARGSGTFNSVKDKYDIGAGFAFNNEGKICTNFYHLGSDKYDLSKIAVKHGGGGHKGAAGCTINKLEDLYKIKGGKDK